MAFSFSFILLYTEKRSLYWNPLNSFFFILHLSLWLKKNPFTDIQLVRDQYYSLKHVANNSFPTHRFLDERDESVAFGFERLWVSHHAAVSANKRKIERGVSVNHRKLRHINHRPLLAFLVPRDLSQSKPLPVGQVPTTREATDWFNSLHTHTHPHIYIYIYKEMMKKERKEKIWPF